MTGKTRSFGDIALKFRLVREFTKQARPAGDGDVIRLGRYVARQKRRMWEMRYADDPPQQDGQPPQPGLRLTTKGGQAFWFSRRGVVRDMALRAAEDVLDNLWPDPRPLSPYDRLYQAFKRAAEIAPSGDAVSLAGYTARRGNARCGLFGHFWDITAPPGPKGFPGNRIVPIGGCASASHAVRIMARCAAEDALRGRLPDPVRRAPS